MTLGRLARRQMRYELLYPADTQLLSKILFICIQEFTFTFSQFPKKISSHIPAQTFIMQRLDSTKNYDSVAENQPHICRYYAKSSVLPVPDIQFVLYTYLHDKISFLRIPSWCTQYIIDFNQTDLIFRVVDRRS